MNVLLYVSDSLRYDFLPAEIRDMGLSLKTVASSLYTATSFPSMLTGLYPPKHGVHTWRDALRKDIKTLLNLKGFHTSLWCETIWTESLPDESGIHRVLNNPAGIPLTEIKEPFVYVEDDKGGHCPYGLPSGQYMGRGCPDFFKEYGAKGEEALALQYGKGIEESGKNFQKRLQVLRNRGLMDRTLVIFTSDHGELLGEYGGLTGHVRPPCPELVYVPTVFIHPLIKKRKPAEGIIRHVDLYPSVCGFLGIKCAGETDGVNIFDAKNYPEYGFNFKLGGTVKKITDKRTLFTYDARSVWDEKGGWIFHDFNYIMSLAYFLYRLKTHEFNFFKGRIKNKNIRLKYNDVRMVFRHLTSRSLRYNEPHFREHQAYSMLKRYMEEVGAGNSQSFDMSEKEKEQLKGLGYID